MCICNVFWQKQLCFFIFWLSLYGGQTKCLSLVRIQFWTCNKELTGPGRGWARRAGWAARCWQCYWSATVRCRRTWRPVCC